MPRNPEPRAAAARAGSSQTKHRGDTVAVESAQINTRRGRRDPGAGNTSQQQRSSRVSPIESAPSTKSPVEISSEGDGEDVEMAGVEDDRNIAEEENEAIAKSKNDTKRIGGVGRREGGSERTLRGDMRIAGKAVTGSNTSERELAHNKEGRRAASMTSTMKKPSQFGLTLSQILSKLPLHRIESASWDMFLEAERASGPLRPLLSLDNSQEISAPLGELLRLLQMQSLENSSDIEFWDVLRHHDAVAEFRRQRRRQHSSQKYPNRASKRSDGVSVLANRADGSAEFPDGAIDDEEEDDIEEEENLQDEDGDQIADECLDSVRGLFILLLECITSAAERSRKEGAGGDSERRLCLAVELFLHLFELPRGPEYFFAPNLYVVRLISSLFRKTCEADEDRDDADSIKRAAEGNGMQSDDDEVDGNGVGGNNKSGGALTTQTAASPPELPERTLKSLLTSLERFVGSVTLAFLQMDLGRELLTLIADLLGRVVFHSISNELQRSAAQAINAYIARLGVIRQDAMGSHSSDEHSQISNTRRQSNITPEEDDKLKQLDNDGDELNDAEIGVSDVTTGEDLKGSVKDGLKSRLVGPQGQPLLPLFSDGPKGDLLLFGLGPILRHVVQAVSMGTKRVGMSLSTIPKALLARRELAVGLVNTLVQTAPGIVVNTEALHIRLEDFLQLSQKNQSSRRKKRSGKIKKQGVDDSDDGSDSEGNSGPDDEDDESDQAGDSDNEGSRSGRVTKKGKSTRKVVALESDDECDERRASARSSKKAAADAANLQNDSEKPSSRKDGKSSTKTGISAKERKRLEIAEAVQWARDPVLAVLARSALSVPDRKEWREMLAVSITEILDNAKRVERQAERADDIPNLNEADDDEEDGQAKHRPKGLSSVIKSPSLGARFQQFLTELSQSARPSHRMVAVDIGLALFDTPEVMPISTGESGGCLYSNRPDDQNETDDIAIAGVTPGRLGLLKALNKCVWDAVPGIRARSIEGLASLLSRYGGCKSSTRRTATASVEREGDGDVVMEGASTSGRKPRGREGPPMANSTFDAVGLIYRHPTPGLKSGAPIIDVWTIASSGVNDEKQIVRKATLSLIAAAAAVISYSNCGRVVKHQLLNELGILRSSVLVPFCLDASLQVRVKALQTLQGLLELFPESSIVRRLWLEQVFPSISDAESAVSEKVLEYVEKVVVDEVATLSDPAALLSLQSNNININSNSPPKTKPGGQRVLTPFEALLEDLTAENVEYLQRCLALIFKKAPFSAKFTRALQTALNAPFIAKATPTTSTLSDHYDPSAHLYSKRAWALWAIAEEVARLSDTAIPPKLALVWWEAVTDKLDAVEESLVALQSSNPSMFARAGPFGTSGNNPASLGLPSGSCGAGAGGIVGKHAPSRFALDLTGIAAGSTGAAGIKPATLGQQRQQMLASESAKLSGALKIAGKVAAVLEFTARRLTSREQEVLTGRLKFGIETFSLSLPLITPVMRIAKALLSSTTSSKSADSTHKKNSSGSAGVGTGASSGVATLTSVSATNRKWLEGLMQIIQRAFQSLLQNTSSQLVSDQSATIDTATPSTPSSVALSTKESHKSTQHHSLSLTLPPALLSRYLFTLGELAFCWGIPPPPSLVAVVLALATNTVGAALTAATAIRPSTVTGGSGKGANGQTNAIMDETPGTLPQQGGLGLMALLRSGATRTANNSTVTLGSLSITRATNPSLAPGGGRLSLASIAPNTVGMSTGGSALADYRFSVSNSVRAQAFVTLGKLSVMSEPLAKKLMDTFVGHLMEKEDPIVRNNVLVVFSDICVKFTSLADRHVPQLTACLADPVPFVRKQALTLVAGLVAQDYIKCKGLVVFRLLFNLSDPLEDIRLLCKAVVDHIILPRHTNFMPNHFIETVCFLNGWLGHPLFKPSAVGGSAFVKKTSPFCLLNQPVRRQLVYIYFLSHMTDKDKHEVSRKIVHDFLAAFVDGDLLSGRAQVELPKNASDAGGAALRDALKILGCKQMKIMFNKAPSTQTGRGGSAAAETSKGGAKKGKGGSGPVAPSADDMGDDNADEAAKGEYEVDLLKRNLAFQILPTLLSLKSIMEDNHSPFLKDILQCLSGLLFDYKSELSDILFHDPMLAKQLECDFKRGLYNLPDINVSEGFSITQQTQQPPQTLTRPSDLGHVGHFPGGLQHRSELIAGPRPPMRSGRVSLLLEPSPGLMMRDRRGSILSNGDVSFIEAAGMQSGQRRTSLLFRGGRDLLPPQNNEARFSGAAVLSLPRLRAEAVALVSARRKNLSPGGRPTNRSDGVDHGVTTDNDWDSLGMGGRTKRHSISEGTATFADGVCEPGDEDEQNDWNNGGSPSGRQQFRNGAQTQRANMGGQPLSTIQSVASARTIANRSLPATPFTGRDTNCAASAPDGAELHTDRSDVDGRTTAAPVPCFTPRQRQAPGSAIISSDHNLETTLVATTARNDDERLEQVLVLSALRSRGRRHSLPSVGGTVANQIDAISRVGQQDDEEDEVTAGVDDGFYAIKELEGSEDDEEGGEGGGHGAVRSLTQSSDRSSGWEGGELQSVCLDAEEDDGEEDRHSTLPQKVSNKNQQSNKNISSKVAAGEEVREQTRQRRGVRDGRGDAPKRGERQLGADGVESLVEGSRPQRDRRNDRPLVEKAAPPPLRLPLREAEQQETRRQQKRARPSPTSSASSSVASSRQSSIMSQTISRPQRSGTAKPPPPPTSASASESKRSTTRGGHLHAIVRSLTAGVPTASSQSSKRAPSIESQITDRSTSIATADGRRRHATTTSCSGAGSVSGSQQGTKRGKSGKALSKQTSSAIMSDDEGGVEEDGTSESPVSTMSRQSSESGSVRQRVEASTTSQRATRRPVATASQASRSSRATATQRGLLGRNDSQKEREEKKTSGKSLRSSGKNSSSTKKSVATSSAQLSSSDDDCNSEEENSPCPTSQRAASQSELKRGQKAVNVSKTRGATAALKTAKAKSVRDENVEPVPSSSKTRNSKAKADGLPVSDTQASRRAMRRR